MKFNEIATATLDQLTDELAAAGWDSTQTEIGEAREAVANLLLEQGDLAEALGYEAIRWDEENQCYSGFGSSYPLDRSRDDAGGFLITSNVDGLIRIAHKALNQ